LNRAAQERQPASACFTFCWWLLNQAAGKT